MLLSIITETKHWLAVNKLSGIVVEQNPYENSIESLVKDYLSEQYRNPYVGIVHRLDRVTSGVLIVAKKKSALRRLNEQFRLKAVQKTYLAMVSKAPPKESDVLRHYLVKNQKEKRSEIYKKAIENGKFVELKYELLERVDDLYLLKIEPTTGKFHQIRAQLAAMGSPIVGDEKYGSEQTYADRKIALHAYQISFNYPEQEVLKLEKCMASLPEDKLWEKFKLSI